jgi:TIGR03009 family protein
MRIAGWSFATVLFTAPTLFAQQPPAAVPLNPAVPDPLPGLLQQWEQQMKGIKAIQAYVVRTQTDKLDNATTVFAGTAKLLRPDRAELYLTKKDNPQVYERFLLSGNFLYEFQPRQKLLRIHQLPQRMPGQPAIDDNFLGLLFGMSAQEAQRRYSLKLKGSDANYHYILVTPRLPKDRAEFIEARLVLWQKSFLPRQIEFVEPSGNPIKWDIQRIDANAPLGPLSFAPPQRLEPGWKKEIVPVPTAPLYRPGPGSPPPTTVRPSGGR